jgi:ketosteroid isomerase-like protein
MENEIFERTAALVTALERGDVAAAGDVYADGARLLASSAELIEGRTEIEAYWRAGIDLGLAGLAFERQVLDKIRGNVLELGRYSVSMKGESSTPLIEHGSYLVLHAQAADGSWRRAVEVFNPDEPTGARRDNPKEEQ